MRCVRRPASLRVHAPVLVLPMEIFRMLPIRLLVRGGLSALAAGVLLTNGCALPHADAPPGQSIGRVSPALYCPAPRQATHPPTVARSKLCGK